MAGIIGRVWVRVEEGSFEIFEPRVIQVELPRPRAIRHASTALEPGQGLLENLLEGHGRPSTALARMPRERNVCQRTNCSTEPNLLIPRMSRINQGARIRGADPLRWPRPRRETAGPG